MSKLYELKLFSELAGQGCVNRYYYFTDDDDNVAEELADSFESIMIPYVAEVTSGAVSFRGVGVRDVFDGTDNFVLNLNNYNGFIANDDTMPTFVGYGMGLNAVSGFRQGGKRYVGVTEGYGNEGTVDNAGLLSNLAALADSHTFSFILESGLTLIPMLAKKDLAGTIWTLASIVSGVYKRVTTQNSRKANSGGGTILPAYTTKTITDNGDNTYSYNVGTYKGANSSKVLGTNVLYNIPVSLTAGTQETSISYTKTQKLDAVQGYFPRTYV